MHTMEGIYKQSRCRKALRIWDCGLAAYAEILSLQHRLWRQRRDGEIANTVLMVEHPPVITRGARRAANRLLVEPELLAERGIEVVDIRRGGGVTAHNPGQLVFYPIVELSGLGLGISQYIRQLEQIGMELLAAFGVRADRRVGLPGLWIGQEKIASIGVRVSRRVTYHGMAVNIHNDLSIFDCMVPCGLDGVRMTSVFEQTRQAVSMREIKEKLAQLLIRYWSSEELTEYETERQIAGVASQTSACRPSLPSH